MQAYGIDYRIKGKEDRLLFTTINAKDLQSAKKKIGKKHGYKDGRMIIVDKCSIIGYF